MSKGFKYLSVIAISGAFLNELVPTYGILILQAIAFVGQLHTFNEE